MVGDRDAVAAFRTAVVEARVKQQLARELTARASHLAADVLADRGAEPYQRPTPVRLRYPRWGWRRAIGFAVEQRMLSVDYLAAYLRYVQSQSVAHLRRQDLRLGGMVFLGRHVELHAPMGHGRIVVGPWAWIGDGSMFRAHHGHLAVGAKVVTGRQTVANVYLDLEIGDAALLADWVYLCDFDHRHDRVDVPMKDQGLRMTPTRVGRDVWIGVKASVLRGADIGDGSIVASHAVVKRKFDPFSILGGIPAEVIGSRLPDGMSIDEATECVRRGEPIRGGPLGETD
ncbi:MAG: acyltransferase [Nitriliruptoraceae bacterium]